MSIYILYRITYIILNRSGIILYTTDAVHTFISFTNDENNTVDELIIIIILRLMYYYLLYFSANVLYILLYSTIIDNKSDVVFAGMK